MRVLIVDDHPAYRRALSAALSAESDIEVAGEAEDGLAACAEAERLRPDAIVMDLSMPELDGIGAMRRIHESSPEVPVVILTAIVDEGVEHEALTAGAVGFVAKGTALRDLVGALHRAMEVGAA